MFGNRSFVRKRGHPFVLRIDNLFGNRSFVRKGGRLFVRIIDHLFGTRSSVYLWNFFVDSYGTNFWRSKGVFFSRFFVELTLIGGEV